MGKHQLVSYVHVTDEVGIVHVFGPDDTVPAWAVKKITNPKAWATAPAPAPEAPSAPPDGDETAPFDPGAHTVADVLTYLQGLNDGEADEYVRVVEAEKAGQARKGILSA